MTDAHTPKRYPQEDAIRKSAGNVTAAARGLGVGRTALHARIAKSPDLQRVYKKSVRRWSTWPRVRYGPRC
jgi:DNA-binding NtrC family response regulator